MTGMNRFLIKRLNFRDCAAMPNAAGTTIMPGRLYRAGSLDHLSRNEKQVITGLHIATAIDLRSPREQSSRPCAVPGMRRMTLPFDIHRTVKKRIAPFLFRRNGAERIHDVVAQVYREIPLLCGSLLDDLFTVLEKRESYPVCIHCSAGKDRTGYAAAILSCMAGVSFRDIRADYLLSNDSILPRVRAVTRPLGRISFGLIPVRTWESALTVYGDYLEAAFDTIEKEFGSVGDYLRSCGITEARQMTVRAYLCSPLQPV